MTKIQINGVDVDLTEEYLENLNPVVNSSGRRFRLLPASNDHQVDFTYNEIISAVLDAENLASKEKSGLLQTVIAIREKGYKPGFNNDFPILDNISLAFRRAWGALKQAWLVHQAENFIEKNLLKEEIKPDPTKKSDLSTKQEPQVIRSYSQGSKSIEMAAQIQSLIKEVDYPANYYFAFGNFDANNKIWKTFINECSTDFPIVVVCVRLSDFEFAPHDTSPRLNLEDKPVLYHLIRLSASNKNELNLKAMDNSREMGLLKQSCADWKGIVQRSKNWTLGFTNTNF